MLLLLPSHIFFLCYWNWLSFVFLRRSKRIPRDNHVLLSLLWVKYAVYSIHATSHRISTVHTPLIFFFIPFLLLFAYSFISLLLKAKRLLKCVEEKFPFFAASCVIQQMYAVCLWFLSTKIEWIWNGNSRQELFVVLLWWNLQFLVF